MKKKELELYPLQIITDDPEKFVDADVEVSSFSSPDSLDSYKVNVIDLDFQSLWRFSGNSITTINDYKLLNNLRTMISKSNKTKIVFCYPSNITYEYNLRSNQKAAYLRDIPDFVVNLFNKELGCLNVSLIYENNTTTIQGKKFESSFYFDYFGDYKLIKSDRSEKTVAFSANKRIYTTLHICNYSELMTVLDKMDLIKSKEAKPDWFDSISFYNDTELHQQKVNSETQIKDLRKQIDKIDNEIEKNNRNKSILCTNGEELASAVYEILEELIECDLSNFVDVKKEDFLIHKDSVDFIGEIKGVNTNVKNLYISQLDNHMEERHDEHPEENLKQLLIINDQRNKEPSLREPVSEEQIRKSTNNNCLIIRTPELLRTYELFRKGDISSKQIVEAFTENSGLYNIEMLNIKSRGQN